jgi:hypothetical protein
MKYSYTGPNPIFLGPTPFFLRDIKGIHTHRCENNFYTECQKEDYQNLI